MKLSGFTKCNLSCPKASVFLPEAGLCPNRAAHWTPVWSCTLSLLSHGSAPESGTHKRCQLRCNMCGRKGLRDPQITERTFLFRLSFQHLPPRLGKHCTPIPVPKESGLQSSSTISSLHSLCLVTGKVIVHTSVSRKMRTQAQSQFISCHHLTLPLYCTVNSGRSIHGPLAGVFPPCPQLLHIITSQ